MLVVMMMMTMTMLMMMVVMMMTMMMMVTGQPVLHNLLHGRQVLLDVEQAVDTRDQGLAGQLRNAAILRGAQLLLIAKPIFSPVPNHNADGDCQQLPDRFCRSCCSMQWVPHIHRLFKSKRQMSACI